MADIFNHIQLRPGYIVRQELVGGDWSRLILLAREHDGGLPNLAEPVRDIPIENAVSIGGRGIEYIFWKIRLHHEMRPHYFQYLRTLAFGACRNGAFE